MRAVYTAVQWIPTQLNSTQPFSVRFLSSSIIIISAILIENEELSHTRLTLATNTQALIGFYLVVRRYREVGEQEFLSLSIVLSFKWGSALVSSKAQHLTGVVPYRCWMVLKAALFRFLVARLDTTLFAILLACERRFIERWAAGKTRERTRRRRMTSGSSTA